jgi:hypothetical protein
MRSRLWMQTAAVSHPPRLRKQFITTFRIMIIIIIIICCLAFNVPTISNPRVSVHTYYLSSVSRVFSFFFFFFMGGEGLILGELKKSGKLNRTIICPGALVTQVFFFFNFGDIKKLAYFFQKCCKFY